ncbi:MAG: restriction endonuclease [Spirochaetaceae bacterium]|nr:restriction endonuclease [Spirochaetaceae bacterium]
MSLRLAAIEVLRELGPMHYQALTERILERRPASSTSKTPSASVRATINGDIKKYREDSAFVRVGRGVYGLRSLHVEATVPDSIEPGGWSSGPDDTAEVEEETSDELRVRTPIFPTYREVRELLRVWPGRPRKQVTALRSTINELRGTPQNTVDWTDPDGWIPDRLSGEDRDLARAIWQSSGKSVNPRHTYGHWLLCRRYKLIDESRDGILRLTEVGREFLHQERGDTEAFLDEREGMVKLLAMVADIGPTRAGGLLAKWSEYLSRYSRFGTQSTFRDTLRRRLNNLLDRELIAREGTMYSITDNGIDYLQRLRREELRDGDEYGQLWELVKRQALSVREDLRAFLSSLDPFVFEHLVKRLLVEMDYQDVEVTTRSGDGGVDVVANIELGITRIREVIQAKRHKRTIQRKDLDALRGSLYRFNAVRGTIITTSKYSSGTAEAAFATGAAPITLIDGEKLIDLLVEYGIGVRKRTVEMLEFDRDAFSDLETDG